MESHGSRLNKVGVSTDPCGRPLLDVPACFTNVHICEVLLDLMFSSKVESHFGA